MKRKIVLWACLLCIACGDNGGNGDDGDNGDNGDTENIAPSDSNLAHIHVWGSGRGLPHIDSSLRGEAYDFAAPKMDVVESTLEGAAELRKRNPNIEVYNYAVDMTFCRHAHCLRSSEELADPPGVEESFFLHVMEDTQATITFVLGTPRTGSVSITGCTGQITRECRLETGIWGDYRWVFNQKDPGFRAWMSNWLLEQADGYDGVFLDEHGPGMHILWPEDAVGGGLAEYGGKTPHEVDEEYNADLTAALADHKQAFSAVGKFLTINGALWSTFNELVMDQIKAAGGTLTEFLHNPTTFDGSSTYERFLDGVQELVDAKARVGLFDIACRDIEGAYNMTAGNYSSAFARWHMWRLASYYLAREMPGKPASDGRAYFAPNWCIQFTDPAKSLDFFDEWLLAYETDVGDPDGPRDGELFASGTAPESETEGCGGKLPQYGVFSRSYDDGNVLVLLRPQDRWDCTVYGDETIVVFTLDMPRKMLMGDGTLGPATATIELRNAEAAILFK